MDTTTDSLFDLPPAEKLQLVEDLWDDLAACPQDVPIHDWQKDELARRKANLMSHPASAVSWEEAKARIRSRHGRKPGTRTRRRAGYSRGLRLVRIAATGFGRGFSKLR